MKKIFSILFLLSFLYVGLAFMFGRVNLNVRNDIYPDSSPRKFYDYAGVINIHSNRSAGSASISSIHQSASDAQLDYFIITDTNDFEPPVHKETYLNDTLMLIGGEYSFVDSRLLNLGFKNLDHLQSIGRNQILFADMLDRGNVPEDVGFFLLAHPDKPGYELGSSLPPGLNGIELYNLKSIWQLAWLNKRSSFMLALFLYPINVQWSFARLFASYTHPELSLWEKENTKRKLVGYAGADADSNTRLPWGSWEIPSYESYFSIMRNHILIKSELTGNIQSDKQKIMGALKAGQFYVSLDLIGNAKGFEAYIIDKNKDIHPIGSEIEFDNADKLVIDLSAKPNTEFRVLIFRNGEQILSSNSLKSEMKLHANGLYRAVVQVRIDFPFEGPRWVNWILTNHFYLE